MDKFLKKLSDFRIMMREETLKKYASAFAIMLVISLLLEIFVFNTSFTLSMFAKEVPVANMSVSGGTKNNDGTYKATSSKIAFEIKNINQDVGNLNINVVSGSNEKTNVTISMIDEGNKSYYSSASRTVLDKVKRSHYIRLNPAGEVKSIKIEAETSSGSTVNLKELGLNVKVPLMFSITRFLFVFMIMTILFILRPKSFVYRYKINLKSMKQRVLLIVLVVTQIVAFYQIANLNPFFAEPTRHYYDQYHELTESLLEGHTYLVQHEVSDNLKNMDNPYDLQERYSTLTKDNGGKAWDYEWDHAYFDGKVYVYFGIAPVIFLYIPFYLLTGKTHHLPDNMAIFIIGACLVLAVMFLLYQIIKKWFKKTPLALYLIMSCLFINSCGIVYALQRPDLYSVPVTMSVLFGVLGIGFWIGALRDSGDGFSNEKISVPYLTLGSICVACTSGCRPQTLCIILLGIILYWGAVFKDRTLFSKQGKKATMALCIPFIVIAAGIMTYNAVRFGSPFDYGANYNLTNNDMRYRGFNFDRIFSAIHYYFFAPVVVQGGFPFVNRTPIELAYQGKTIAESMFGAFPANPILWVNFTAFGLKNKFSDKRLFTFVMTALALAVVLAVLAAQVAAIYLRYLTDFSWLLLLAASIVVFLLYSLINNDALKRWFIGGVLVCFVLGMTFHGLWIFTDISDNLKDLIPVWWYNMQHLIAFWL